MRYTFTVTFECSTDELAELAFQNAVEKIAHAEGGKFLQANLSRKASDVSTLRPEDFSTWFTRRGASNEEESNYDRLLAKGSERIRRNILTRLYKTPYSKSSSTWNTAVIDALSAIENLEVIS